MRCHYEVLELDRFSCTSDDIKRAYRKMALKWHPDKNVDNAEEATQQFKDVTAAHTVLSDVRERLWYDDHRDAILRGARSGRGNEDDDDDDDDDDEDIIDIWCFFSDSCYDDYDDEPEGFYTVYRHCFEDIVKQENNVTDGKVVNYPSFGDSTLTDDHVINFYNQWSNFLSILSFSWHDEHNPSEAPDRRVRREIEKINKKQRDIGKRKYIDSIHSLISYLRKRDPRYIKIDEKREAIKQADIAKKEEEKKEELERRAIQREKNLAFLNSPEEIARREAELEGAYLIADHSSSEDDNDAWGEIGGRVRRTKRRGKKGLNKKALQPMEEEYDSDELEELKEKIMQLNLNNEAEAAATEEQEEIVYHCEVCDKNFKEEKQLQQHQNSKPHKAALKIYEKKNKGKSNNNNNGPKAVEIKATSVDEVNVTASFRTSAKAELGGHGGGKEPKEKNNKKKFQLKGAKGMDMDGMDGMDGMGDDGLYPVGDTVLR
jgi:curved DNA-binding protein CbpA